MTKRKPLTPEQRERKHAYDREWRAAHKGYAKSYRKQWAAANPGYLSQWRATRKNARQQVLLEEIAALEELAHSQKEVPKESVEHPEVETR